MCLIFTAPNALVKKKTCILFTLKELKKVETIFHRLLIKDVCWILDCGL